jgi:hypothetical protein
VNPAIRGWIERNHQPWRRSPKRSLFLGRIGAPGSLIPDSDTLKYFQNRGVEVAGRFFEDLQERDFFDILEKLNPSLPPNTRRLCDDKVAFGMASTRSPNAYAVPVLDGYAILFDATMVTLLTGVCELFVAAIMDRKGPSAQSFELAFNTALASVFFRRATFWSPVPDRFVHRDLVDSDVWLMSVFLLAHEIGHVAHGHLDHAPTREATVSSGGEREALSVLSPEQSEEFEADAFAIELMFRADGGLRSVGSDRNAFWSSAYRTLGWLFSLFDAIERLSVRLDVPVDDTHPHAAERWKRVAERIRAGAPIRQTAVETERMTSAWAIRSADLGELPDLADQDTSNDEEDYTALPYSEDLSQLLRGETIDAPRAWQQPDAGTFMEWINAKSPDDARVLLTRHPELLHPNVDLVHYRLADDQEQEGARAHILLKRLPLLRRARDVGIDAAFDDYAAGRIPISVSVPEFEVPKSVLAEHSDAIRSGDVARQHKIVASSPELAACLKLPDTMELLLRTRFPAETKKVIDEHPELYLPIVDKLFETLVRTQPTDAARRRVESLRAVLARARDVGADRALVEARYIWGVDEHGRPVK